MKNALHILLGAALCGLAAFGYQPPALAQNALQALVVTTCGTPLTTYTAGRPGAVTLDTSGRLCDGASSGGSTTANQGTAGTNAQAWWVRIGDATNGPVAVKPASTPSVATDLALAVDIRPNCGGCQTLGPATPAQSLPVVSAGYTYGHITTATTTTLKSGAGVLHTVCINALGTVASTVTVDDATSATTPTIAVINSLAVLGCQTYDVAFGVGLTLVTTGTVAPDVTVSFR